MASYPIITQVGEMKPVYALLFLGLAQSQRRSSQSLRQCSLRQYLTNLHLPQSRPRTAGCAESVPALFPLMDDSAVETAA